MNFIFSFLLLASLLTLPRSVYSQEQKQPDNNDVFVENAEIIHQWCGEKPNSEFGWVARVVGDLDGDKVSDFVTTAPSYENNRGKIYVYSSKSGKLLFEKTGKPGERLGNGAATAGDVNLDGTPDVIVGAPYRSAAYVYSGLDGKLLLELSSGEKNDKFGYKVCSVFDLNGDGHDDVCVSATEGKRSDDPTGLCYVYSGKTGELMFKLRGERGGDKFGSAVCATRHGHDVLLAIGAQDADDNKRGKVYVYRITKTKPELAFEVSGDTNSVNLGIMFVSFPGDINQDGVPDVYASDFSDNSGAPGAGKVVVCSGVDGKKLLEIKGKQRGEGFGTSPSEAGDVNGDGIGDLVIGAWQNLAGAKSGGRVTLHDGKNGKLLQQWTCKVPNETFGFDCCGIGDVNDDGNIDFLITGAWSKVNGTKSGRVFIVAGKNPR